MADGAAALPAPITTAAACGIENSRLRARIQKAAAVKGLAHQPPPARSGCVDHTLEFRGADRVAQRKRRRLCAW